jgi:endonuclease/exonuclease/phosphatase family metal-dependent hydrolase
MARIFSWNINTDRRISGQYRAYEPVYGVEARWPRIETVLARATETHDIVSLCEVGRKDLAPLLCRFFADRGWMFVCSPYCNDPFSFLFVMAWNPAAWRLSGFDHLALTEDGKHPTADELATLPKPERTRRFLESDFPKSVPQFRFASVAEAWEEEFQVWQIHLGLSNAHRVLACRKLAGDLPQPLPVVMIGDWNCFDMTPGAFPAYLAAMFDELRPACSYFSPSDLPADAEAWSLRAYDFDIRWRMTPDHIAEEKALLDSGDGDALRSFHARVIEELNAAYRELHASQPEPVRAGVPGLFEHRVPTDDIRKSVVMDMAVAKGVELCETELLPLEHSESDHLPLSCTVTLPY